MFIDSAINSTTHALQRSAMFPAMVSETTSFRSAGARREFLAVARSINISPLIGGEEQQYPVALPS